ncbi:hypothetical protein H0H93_011282 [Arthromyces matolae]|nr:hypothetical protein H0H93_011282 [Arthromyces matolae]
MNPRAEKILLPEEVYHAAQSEFLQNSPSYFEEIKSMIISRNDTDLENYVKPIFKHLAKNIGAREDLPVWPLTLFKYSLLVACDINNGIDMRESAFEVLVEYIQSEHQKFLGTWNIHQLNMRSPEENFRALDQAFRAEYLGGTVSGFCDALKDYRKMYEQRKHYGKVIPIVQSSGTGKSRVVAEVGKDHYVLSVCFRDIRNLEYDPNKGWPPHDVSACQFFVEDVHNLNAPNFTPKGEEMAGAFLGALLEVVGEDLPNRKSPEEFSQAWRSEAPYSTLSTLSSRQAHFERIRDLAKRKLLLHAEVLNKNRNLMPAVKEAASPWPVNDPSYREEMIQRVDWYKSVYDTLVKDHAQRIMEHLEKTQASEEKSFILSFDECAELNLTTPHWYPQDKMTLLALRRLLKAGEDHNIWYVLLDTTSEIEHIIPVTGELAASFRRRTGLSPLPPYMYIYSNVMLDRLEETPATPKRTLRLDFLQHFGRPYWCTLPSSEVLVMAQLKLVGKQDFHTTDVNQVLAVFSARLILELGTGQTTTRLAINGVRRHMRVLECVSATGFVNTSVPSEPMLAIAAGALLTNSTPLYKKAIDQLVKEIILKEHVLERGRLGELLARIILMMARDFAIAPSKDNSDRRRFVQEDESGQFVYPVRLDAFLQALLGENLSVDGVAFPHLHQHRQDLLAWAHPQFVNFTHFMQVNETIDDLSPEFLMPSNACPNGSRVDSVSRQASVKYAQETNGT